MLTFYLNVSVFFVLRVSSFDILLAKSELNRSITSTCRLMDKVQRVLSDWLNILSHASF